jgi:hypothetical protein
VRPNTDSTIGCGRSWAGDTEAIGVRSFKPDQGSMS